MPLTQFFSLDVYFNTGYWRWPPKRPDRGPPPDGALVWKKQDQKQSHNVNEKQIYERLNGAKASCYMTTPVQTVQGYKKWRLRLVQVLGQDDSVQWEVEDYREFYINVTLQHAKRICFLGLLGLKKRGGSGESNAEWLHIEASLQNT